MLSSLQIKKILTNQYAPVLLDKDFLHCLKLFVLPDLLISTGRRNSPPPPPPLSLKTVKAVTLAFCSIQLQHSVTLLQTFMPSLVSITRPSLQILGKTQTGVFPISGQSLVKENCHNSRVRDDIDMKLGPVTTIGKRNKTTSNKIDDDVMSENCDVTAIYRIFGQFGADARLDSWHRVCKSYAFSSSNLLSYKT